MVSAGTKSKHFLPPLQVAIPLKAWGEKINIYLLRRRAKCLGLWLLLESLHCWMAVMLTGAFWGLAGSMALRLELFAGGSQGFKIQ